MKKSARLAVLDVSAAIMELTTPLHEALCDEGQCDLENPCPYCKINEILMTALTTESIDDGT